MWGTTDGAVDSHAGKLMLAVAGEAYSTNVLVCEAYGSKTAGKPELAP